MIDFNAFNALNALNENVKNLLIKDMELKKKYSLEVWSILQEAYSSIGGLKGSGFNSVDDMIENIPFWKLIMKDSIVHGVVMYKDSGGRKAVALGALKGSSYGITMIKSIFKDTFKVSFGELSKAALNMALKSVPYHIVRQLIHTPESAEKILGKETTPIKDIPKDEWPSDAIVTIKKFPWLLDYGYLRILKGKPYFKVLIGKEGLQIK